MREAHGYISNDGMFFTTQRECIEHEDELLRESLGIAEIDNDPSILGYFNESYIDIANVVDSDALDALENYYKEQGYIVSRVLTDNNYTGNVIALISEGAWVVLCEAAKFMEDAENMVGHWKLKYNTYTKKYPKEGK